MQLLRTELRKILPYRTVWVILAIYVLLMLLVLYASSGMVINGQQLGREVYQFPAVWPRLTYLASFFNLLLGILVIVLVSDEYTFRTLRQQVMDGLSRAEVILAKFYVALAVAAFSTLVLLGVGLYFGLRYSSATSAALILGQMDHLFYYFVQAVGYMCLALLSGFLIRKSGLAIIAFIAWAKIVEPLLHFRLPDTVDKFFPMKVLGSLTPMPGQELLDQLTTPTELLSPQVAVLPALAYAGLFLLGSYLIIRFRDL